MGCDEQRSIFLEQGYVVLPGAVSEKALMGFEQGFLSLVKQETGVGLENMHDPGLVQLLESNRDYERVLYDRIRAYPWLSELCLSPDMVAPVEITLGESSVLLSKLILRIDLPGVTRELAVWHQDQHYVGGSLDIVTAWLPLQDTGYKEGCLMVMPGSHRQGPKVHDNTVLEKRHFPSGIFDMEVRYQQMMRGDLLLFHSCLLHSSSLNISDRIRFSIQARYCPESGESEKSMGDRLKTK